jgi:predicted transposase YbfD/YdcC
MKLKPKIAILDYFSVIKDPRVERTKRHKLIDIITITICAVISGADTYVEIEEYGKAKYQWLKSILELPNGIPSHDTFSRVFSRINPQEFQQCFLKWIESITQLTQGEIIAIDGKTLRHSYDKNSGNSAIHMVSAWATKNSLTLGQIKVNKKSNEITAIPELLKVLCLNGCVVTIDAMGCQKEIVNQIINQGADYIIALKKNQDGLYNRVVELFKKVQKQSNTAYLHTSGNHFSESTHGREETRYYQVIHNVKDEIDPKDEWKNITSIIKFNYLRIEKNGKMTFEEFYYISSLSNDATKFAHDIRQHWKIENQLHWVLDVQFNEDDSRIRKDNSPENLAIVRHIALNLLNQEKTLKVGIKAKRHRAGWDNDYLLKVLLR